MLIGRETRFRVVQFVRVKKGISSWFHKVDQGELSQLKDMFVNEMSESIMDGDFFEVKASTLIIIIM